MKLFIIMFFIIGLSSLLFVLNKKSSVTHISPINKYISATPTVKQPMTTITYELQNKTYKAYWIKSNSDKNISLISNFLNAKTAQDIKKENKCNYLTSGGFYTQEHSPTGLFISENTTVKKFQSNKTLNGVFSLQKNGVFQITSTPLQTDVYFSLQSGPQLLKNGYPETLRIQNDESARRIIVATNQHPKEIVFITIIDAENIYQGPLLSEIPSHLKKIEPSIESTLVDALNLDGGSASAFSNENVFLQELTPVGSFFCIH